MKHPNGRCQHCGEPLRLVPCTNCKQLAAMNDSGAEDDVSADLDDVVQRDAVAMATGRLDE